MFLATYVNVLDKSMKMHLFNYAFTLCKNTGTIYPPKLPQLWL